MIPKFNKQGYLPPGKHKTTWSEFESYFAYNDPRQALMLGVKAAVDNLKRAGCQNIYINGSFVTAKSEPNDWDACWEITGVDFDKLDSTIVDEEFNHRRRKAKYLGDLFLNAPNLPGHNYVEFFQKSRDGIRKGIIVISLATLK